MLAPIAEHGDEVGCARAARRQWRDVTWQQFG
jgi:hypothetical protein